MKRLLFCAIACAIAAVSTSCATSRPAQSPAALERWNVNHPQAASDLCRWVSNHPNAAPAFFEWDSNHPQKSQELVLWTLAHQNQGIDAFVAAHPGWNKFDWMSETHKPAANTFLGWIRLHPRAAQDLMGHPGGLRWAAHHSGC